MSRQWCIKRLPAIFLLICSMLLSLVFAPGFLFAKNLASENPSDAISITSEKMTLKNIEGIILFEGNVVIQQEDMTVNADRAEVFLSKPKESASLLTPSGDGREVTRMITSGNVRIIRGSQQAKAEKGVYNRDKEVFVLTGNPEAWDDEFHVKGETITFFIEEERILVADSEAMIFNGTLGLSEKRGR